MTMARKPRRAERCIPIWRFRALHVRLRKLYKTMSRVQRKRILDENFGSLLKLASSRIPAELASWLMVECFDPESSQLVLPGRGRIAVTADVVSDILGLPNSGDEVKYEFDVEAINFIHEEYGIEKGVAPHIDTIMDRVRDNKEADDDFFRSWLMIVMSTFLCPRTHLTISPRCYPPLVDLARAKDLNWCQFVVDQLKDAAQMIDKKNSVMGCLFLLVILYLDSLEVGNVDIPETKPRIAAWNWKLLDEVIKLDTNQDGTFGKLKLKGRDRQGNSVIQDSLFQIDDIRRFVSSNVSKRMTDQKKRKLTDAVAKFFGGFTELVGNFLEQVSEVPGICEAARLVLLVHKGRQQGQSVHEETHLCLNPMKIQNLMKI